MRERRKRGRAVARGPSSGDALSLASLCQRVDAVVAKDDTRAGVGERRAFITVIVGLALIQLALLPLPPMVKLVMMLSGVLLEVVGLLVWPVLWYRRNRHEFRFSQRFFAEEMDKHNVQFHGLVRWIRRFPEDQRAALLRYVRYRQKHLSYRVGALTGGFAQLALLPPLAALYFQFKDWSFTGWDSLHINRPAAFVVLAMVILYIAGLMAVRLRIRLDQYEMLLTESLTESP